MVQIGGPPLFGGGDRLAQRGDDLRRAQRELGQFVPAQRRRELGGRGIEMEDAAGAVEQHRRIRHAGDDRGHRRALDRIDVTRLLPGGGGIMQAPGDQRGSCDAEKDD